MCNDIFFFAKSMATCRVWTNRDTSRQIDANPNSISFRGWRRPLRVRAEIYVCKVRVARWSGREGCSAAERGREKSAVSRLFPRESGKCEFVGTPTRGRTGERNRTFTNITLFLGRGVPRDERGEGPVGLMHPFAWIIAIGPTTFFVPLPPPHLVSFRLFLLFAPRPATILQ